MYGRYKLYVCDRNNDVIFNGNFTSINHAAKTLACFVGDNLSYDLHDDILDKYLDADEIREVFLYDDIIL